MFALKTALPIAQQIEEKLKPYVEVIHIAGSIRREKYEVKDIEIVCIPRKDIIPGQQELFGGDTRAEQRVSASFCGTVNDLGTRIKGLATGRNIQVLLHQRITLDLFMPRPEDYFRQLAIRTGSKEYVRNNIAGGWRRKGWVGVADLGLRREQDCEIDHIYNEKPVWKTVAANPELPPIWVSEKDFFDWLGIQWLHPKYRTV